MGGGVGGGRSTWYRVAAPHILPCEVSCLYSTARIPERSFIADANRSVSVIASARICSFVRSACDAFETLEPLA